MSELRYTFGPHSQKQKTLKGFCQCGKQLIVTSLHNTKCSCSRQYCLDYSQTKILKLFIEDI